VHGEKEREREKRAQKDPGEIPVLGLDTEAEEEKVTICVGGESIPVTELSNARSGLTKSPGFLVLPQPQILHAVSLVWDLDLKKKAGGRKT
jgi:hypothetical protein